MRTVRHCLINSTRSALPIFRVMAERLRGIKYPLAPVGTLVLFYGIAAGQPIPSGIVINVDGQQMTLQAALQVARSSPPSTPRTIVLRGGRYLLETPLTLTPQDSNLTIQSADGERAELCGGRQITGWRQEGSGPMWVASLPDFHSQPWRFRVLTVNGKVADRARLPETGFFSDLDPDFQVGSRPATNQELTTLNYRTGDLGPWLDLQSAEVRVYRVWDESLSKIAWIDDTTHTVGFLTPLRYPPGAFGVHKYEVLNVREGLRAPGQWFLDYGANEVHYWPRPGEDMSTAQIWAPVTEVLIRMEGTNIPVANVTLSNLDLTLTDVPAKSSGFAGAGYDGAISMSGTDSVTFSGLRIRQVGASGIQASIANKTRVLACEFLDTGACTISTYESSDMEIADCRIASAGHSTPAAAGMELLGDRIHVHHNEVHDIPYSGISVAGVAPVVEFNHVFHVMLKMADGSAYYADGGSNGLVRNNWANDVGTGPESQAPAYYLDEQTTGFTIEHNVAAVMNWLVHIHMASSNTIRENVLVSSGDARLTFQGSTATILAQNVIYAGGILGYEAAAGAISAQSGSILYSGQNKIELLRLEDYQRVPFDTAGNLVADPHFVDLTHSDFDFLPGSPALPLGIPQPPAISEVGPRTMPLSDPPPVQPQTLPSPCDLNHDGLVNVVDVQMAASQALGLSICTADLDHDGTCSVADVQRIIAAALGMGCM